MPAAPVHRGHLCAGDPGAVSGVAGSVRVLLDRAHAASRGGLAQPRLAVRDHAHPRPERQSAVRDPGPQRGTAHLRAAGEDLADRSWPQPSPPRTRIFTATPASTSGPSCAPSGRTTPREARAAAPPPSRSNWHAPSCSPPRNAASAPTRAKRARSSWRGDHTALYQGPDPGTVSQRDLLRESGLWHRGGLRDLFRQVRRSVDAGRGLLPGRPAAIACGVRYLHQPGDHTAAPAAGAGPDVRPQPGTELHPREQHRPRRYVWTPSRPPTRRTR